jgi:hypothetical protein
MKKQLVGMVLVCQLGLVPALASAQTTVSTSGGLRSEMSGLLVRSIVLAQTPAGTGIVAHTPTFLDDPSVTDLTTLVNQVSQQIGSQVSNFPLGSSAGGFTYSYDSALGTFNRSSASFGPSFAERAVSAGKNKFSFGTNYFHSKYNSLDGKDLENGSIKFYLNHQHLNPPSFVEGDVIQAALEMKLTSDTVAFLANYGVTNHLDVGVAVPIVRIGMNLTYHATILDFATHVVSPTTHVFANGSKQADFQSSGNASGLGDVVLRTKYVFSSKASKAVALGLDLTLPTGDDQNMLGSGSTQARFLFITSGTMGSHLSPHLNIGYDFASGGIASDQFGFVGGSEIVAGPRVTFSGDVLARTYRDALRLSDVSVPHTFQQGATAPIETTTLNAISVGPKNLSSILATAGAKVNVVGNLLITGNLLFPLNNAGLRPGVTPVVGFDYTF